MEPSATPVAADGRHTRARDAEEALRRRAAELNLSSRTIWVGETPHIHALLGASDAVVLPSTSLFAKMDYPLVLLEAMSLGRAVFVVEGDVHRMEVGGAYLVNVNASHGVWNGGETPRIHLMFDVVK